MNILSPSILSADFTRLGEEIRAVDEAGAQYIHVDVMDGMFVPSISYGMPVIRSIRGATKKVFDVHLMINEPIRYIKDFVDSGADIIGVHVEACSDVAATLNEIKKYNKKCSLAINPETPKEALIPYLSMLDMVLVMSVHPGFGGQKFLEGSLEKVAAVRKMLDDAGLKTDIEIDGGINLQNIEAAAKAGANIIVAGSAVFKGDAAENTRRFISMINRKGNGTD